MSERGLMRRRNNNARKVRFTNRRRDIIRFGEGESYEHALCKFMICYVLKTYGKSFITEAIFKNGKRADVYVLDDDVAVEVRVSEEEDSILDKKDEYPCSVSSYEVMNGFSREEITDFLMSVLRI